MSSTLIFKEEHDRLIKEAVKAEREKIAYRLENARYLGDTRGPVLKALMEHAQWYAAEIRAGRFGS